VWRCQRGGVWVDVRKGDTIEKRELTNSTHQPKTSAWRSSSSVKSRFFKVLRDETTVKPLFIFPVFIVCVHQRLDESKSVVLRLAIVHTSWDGVVEHLYKTGSKNINTVLA
jgi:hypothetical protein